MPKQLTRCLSTAFLLGSAAAAAGCASPGDGSTTNPMSTDGGSRPPIPGASTGGAGRPVAGGAGASSPNAGAGRAGSSSAVAGSGGRAQPGYSAGRAAQGGSGRAGGTTSPAAGSGGAPGPTPPQTRAPEPLDCGPNGIVIENAGPPKNRVNYVIVGDGYTADQLDTTFVQHIQNAMKKRFSEVIGQPYGRYRKFVNICAIKLPSATGPIGKGATALECTGDDQSRLARCNSSKVNTAIADNLPDSFEVDWKAVVLNNERWWNTGAVIMLWSGANKDAAGAALHEGGHGFHQLADEYTGTDTNCTREFNEVNTTADAKQTAGKWDLWLGYDQVGATGKQGTVAGSRYCNAGQYRPSDNSMMNQLFGDKPNTSYNSVSREKMIMDIWRAVTPIDVAMPAPGALTAADLLAVIVIDPAVVHVDWSVDGKLVRENGGETFDLKAQNLPAGKHTITARAYDTAGDDLVRYTTGTQYGRMNWARSQQTVTWTLEQP